ncbi:MULTISPECIES: hypothetical protein [Cyanophyceae]|nr:hypothetical protein [Trichocoleus sp. FACHB-40]
MRFSTPWRALISLVYSPENQSDRLRNISMEQVRLPLPFLFSEK